MHITKILNNEIQDLELFTGINCKIKLCCIIFYELAWLTSIRKKIPEYSETMWDLSDHSGILLCPECLTKTLKKK